MCVLVLGYKLLKILVTLKAKPQGRGVEKFGKILVNSRTELIGVIVGKQKVCVGGGVIRLREHELLQFGVCLMLRVSMSITLK